MSTSIGQSIRVARMARGWTQGDLADRVDVSRVTIAMWESNATAPRAQRIVKVAKVLGLKPADLLP